jgi:D-proline reductase (dithiol) PrdB
VRISELPFRYRTFLRAYSWRRVDPIPRSILRRPLSDCRVAMVSSAGLVMPGDAPFDTAMAGGDHSWREIPADAAVQTLEEGHRSAAFDRSGLAVDRNVALPLDRLRELVEAGTIGTMAPRHISLMGSVTKPDLLIRESLPQVAERLVADGVDVALLAPV